MTPYQGEFIEDDDTKKRFSYAEFVEHVVEQFPADRYVFWGAEFNVRQNSGCVPYYFEKLELPNKELDTDACLNTSPSF